jgi:hypothetical protein
MSDDRGDGGFSADEKNTLVGVLDSIIPQRSDGTLPGAGEIGLADDVERAVQRTPEMKPTITGGLTALQSLAGERDYGELSAEERATLLRGIESEQPAFVPTLMFLTYTAYYQNERVAKGLGLSARPPHPLGYEMPPNDLTLLDAVRQRPKMHREC